MTSHDSLLKMRHHPAVSLLAVCRAKTGQIKGWFESEFCPDVLITQHVVVLAVALISSVDRYLKRSSLFWLIDKNSLPIIFSGNWDLCGNSRSLDTSTCLSFCASLILQSVLMVAIPYCIYSCGSLCFLAFHEWQQVHRYILPKNISTCWSHHVNYSCHIQYDHRCLFGGWIITISWHRWQAPKYLWFCASSKFTFVWQCWGLPCIFMHEELGHVWGRYSLKRNEHLGYYSCCKLVWCCFIT